MSIGIIGDLGALDVGGPLAAIPQIALPEIAPPDS
jgi:hypothetical protein